MVLHLLVNGSGSCPHDCRMRISYSGNTLAFQASERGSIPLIRSIAVQCSADSPFYFLMPRVPYSWQWQIRETASREVHTLEAAGSTPASATIVFLLMMYS